MPTNNERKKKNPNPKDKMGGEGQEKGEAHNYLARIEGEG